MRTVINHVFNSGLVLFFAASCGGTAHPPAENPMTSHAEALGARITQLKTELTNHGTAAHHASDLTAFNQQEGTHHTTSLGYLENMEHDLADMAACKDAKGAAPDNQAFATLRNDAHHEGEAHNTAVTTASTIEQAHTEETRHQAAMETLLSKMVTQHQAMMGQAAMYSCAMSHNAGH